MSLTLYPAIDLKGGECVRLFQGEMDRATVYNDNPAAQARAFREAGFEWLHCVDLDGAFAGEAANAQAVESILAALSEAGGEVKVQLGGGIRTMAAVERWLSLGLARVILGTAAVKNPELVLEAARAFPGQVAVGIDARGDKVATEGWGETSEHSVADIARRFEDAGVAAIIYTDISRDGTLTGVNVPLTKELSQSVDIPVIASGGVGSVDDVTALTGSGVEGVIIGRALYDGRVDATEALAASRGGAR